MKNIRTGRVLILTKFILRNVIPKGDNDEGSGFKERSFTSTYRSGAAFRMKVEYERVIG